VPERVVVGAVEVQGTTAFSIDIGLTPQKDERHSYEKCQYDEFVKRVKKMDELKAAKKEEATS
jgi:hypothetical protein